MIRPFLIKSFSYKQRRKFWNKIDDLKTIGFGGNLSRLGKIYGTDKVGKHFYTNHYQSHFKAFKYKGINFLEIGVGGYDKPTVGGRSLRMWKRYFPFGKIYPLDIHEKSFLNESRIKIFQGSQVDEAFLNEVVSETGDLDIIIDDGSHVNEHVIKTFELLFPKLKKGGIYAVEDMQTSYWPDFGGDSENLNNPSTMMNYFKALTDSLNNREFIKPGYVQNIYDKEIVSIHFYHNLMFIHKGDNNEESNLVIENYRKLRSEL